MMNKERVVNGDNIVEVAQELAAEWKGRKFVEVHLMKLVKDLNEAAGFTFIDWDRVGSRSAPANNRAFMEYGPGNFHGEHKTLFTIIYDKDKVIKSIVPNGPQIYWTYAAVEKEVARQQEVEEQERIASEALQAAQREERLKEYKPFNEIIMDMQHGDRAFKWTEEAKLEGKVGISKSYDDYNYFQDNISGPLKLSSVFVNGLYKLVPRLYSAYRALEALEAGHTVRYYKEGSSSPHVEISPEDYLGGLAEDLCGMQVKDLLEERWSIIYKTEE